MKIVVCVLSLLLTTASYANGYRGHLLQNEFDPLGPTMKSFDSSASGRTVAYLDEGQADWKPVMFVGGAGTSGRVFALLEFLRTMRERLRLRFIAVERNGLGQTDFDDTLGYADYASDIEELLERLGIKRFALFAISGGGPYSAEIASRNSDRLNSIHLASALTYADASSTTCAASAQDLRFFTENPMIWFGFPTESPIHKIPGFQDAAFDKAARTFNMGGQVADPAALHHEFQLYCGRQELPNLSLVHAPVFIYHGEADTSVPLDPHVKRWQEAYSSVEAKERLYPKEGHDVQYQHLDQGLGDPMLCRDPANRDQPGLVAAIRRAGGRVLDTDAKFGAPEGAETIQGGV